MWVLYGCLYFSAFANAVARGVVCASQYLGYLLMEFDQTFTTDGLWWKDKGVKFWGQKVKSQRHSGVKYAKNARHFEF